MSPEPASNTESPDSSDGGRSEAERLEKRAARRKKTVREIDLSTVGLVFPMALLIGFFGGRVVGELVGRPGLGTWIGVGLGLLSGFYNLYKVSITLQRRAEREAMESTSVDGDRTEDL